MFKRIRKRSKQKNEIFELNNQDNLPEVCFDDGSVAVFGNAQHQGEREYQEDSFGFSDTSDEFVKQNGLLAVLADGMGGLSNGKAVSERVVSDMLGWFNAEQMVCASGEELKNEISLINRDVCSIFCADGAVTSGSTVVAALIKNSELHWVCVGDSRIYLRRGGKIHQINEDHDFLNQLLGEAIEDGAADVSAAFEDVQKDSLVGCIGKSDLDSFDYSKRGFRLLKGDRVMLCSDGVYNALTESEMCSLLEEEPMIAAERIKNEVLSRRFRGQDNLTVIVIAMR